MQPGSQLLWPARSPMPASVSQDKVLRKWRNHRLPQVVGHPTQCHLVKVKGPSGDVGWFAEIHQAQGNPSVWGENVPLVRPSQGSGLTRVLE